MTKFDKITAVFAAIDAALAIMLLTLGKYPVLATTLSALAAANFTQVVCNIDLRKAEKQNQALSQLVDIFLGFSDEEDEERHDEDEEAENV